MHGNEPDLVRGRKVTERAASKQSELIPPLDLKAQYASIQADIMAEINAVLESQQFILGPQVSALETEVAEYCGARFAVGVASGTDALILALHAAGVGPGDEVLLPAFSFIASADTVSLLGAKPVFADIRPDTFNIDVDQLARLITPRTKAIMPVHLYGQPADMDPVLSIARTHGLKVVEDNAQAIGAKYKDKHTGSMGDFGCISFFPSKNLGAFGDGGMILTNSEGSADRLRSLRNHGSVKKYYSTEQGWNSRLDEIQAAILRVKLRHLDAWAAARRGKAAAYNRLLSGISGVVIPAVAPWAEHVYHQYTIRVPQRDHVQEVLAAHRIASTVYYPTPMHLQPVYHSLGYKPGDLPEAEKASAQVLSLPIFPELTENQIARVAQVLGGALRS
jgi:UDP-N-acetyl-3-dehydro-alpha-D-glucosamine 3-aminotranferase